MDIRDLTALELGNLIKEKKISSPEATKAYLDAANKDFGKAWGDEAKIGAYTELLEESALKAAADAQKKIDEGDFLSPLAGVPVAIKDNICTTEGETTAASKILGGFKSPFDADVCEKLKAAGAVVIGRTNMDEFAMGNTTENSFYGVTRNPWDLARVPGGSSGGSAAAVASGFAPYALGSDTGGSIRQPSGFCNLTGIKPTYGSVSRFGLAAHASSLDQIGPIAKDARDLAVILSVISGKDLRDSTTAMEEPFDFCGILHGKDAGGRLDGKKIGLPKNYLELPELSADVKAKVLEAADTLRSLGAEVREIELPLLEYAIPTYLVISCAEACSNMARYDGIEYGYRSPDAKTWEEVYSKTRGEGFGAEVKRRVLFGYFVLSSEQFDAYYRKALKARGMIKRAFEKALETNDLILSPVSPTSAFEIGRETEDPVEIYNGDIYTTSANLSGLPSAAAPCGFDGAGLPVGMQLIGKAFDDGLILDTIMRFQQATDYHKQKPPCLCERSDEIGTQSQSRQCERGEAIKTDTREGGGL